MNVALKAVLAVLKPQGRLAVISFHSLEDRPVKQFIAKYSQHSKDLAKMPLTQAQLPKLLLTDLGRQKPSAAEIVNNPRARSAVLRVAQKNS